MSVGGGWGAEERTEDLLISAAMWGDIPLLESLLENNADPNLPNAQGNSPLHIAAYYGETECASLLLSYKANVNARGADGKMPLHRAVTGVCVQEPGAKFQTEAKIRENQMDLVRLLTSHGGDLNATENTGATPRDLAQQCDFYECADLIDELKELQANQARDRLRESRIQVLYSACKVGDLDTVRDLLPNVPEAVNEFLQDGINLLMCAASHGQLAIVDHLLDCGAVAVASCTTNQTALHFACQAGHTDVVVCLLNRLPALLAIDDSPRETSLHIAAREGHVEIVRNLLAIAARSEQLKTPEGSMEVDAYLFGPQDEKVVMNDVLPEIIIDVLAPNHQDKKTPLHEAAANGHVEIVKLLVDFMRDYRSPTRPSIDARDSDLIHSNTPTRGESPFHTRKANVIPGIDKFTIKGRTAFHEAAREGHFEVMDILLQAGADINAFMRPFLDVNVNTDLTALVQACLMSRLDIVRFLLQHGATDARLKALARTLRMKIDDVAGLLLCYNGGIHQLSAATDARSRSKPAESSAHSSTVMLSVSWNSKNLPYIRREWLELATTEMPRPKNHSCAISQLDISSNKLTEVPIELFQLPHVTHLDMGRNQLKFLPMLPNVANGGWTCQKLAQLDVNGNRLTSLPACLFALRELKELGANDNSIKEVPVAVWSAPKLHRIYLSRNSLEVFPSEETPLSWDSPLSPAHTTFPVGASVNLGRGMPLAGNMSLPDSGYSGSQISPRGVSLQAGLESVSVENAEARGRRRSLVLPFSTASVSLAPRSGRATTTLGRKRSNQSQVQFVSRRLESFLDTNLQEEEYEGLDTPDLTDEKEAFPLEVLDLSHNSLSSVPAGLSCLAPKLQKLNISYNNIKSLGVINDYPVEIEMLDACHNELHTAIAPPASSSDERYYQPCSRRQLGLSMSASIFETSSFSFHYKPCAHRSHRNLRRLATLKLSNNQLVDLQLFRLVSRNKSGDLTASFEESTVTLKQRANTASDPFAMVVSPTTPRPTSNSPRDDISKSVSVGRSGSAKRGTIKISNELSKQSESSNSSPSSSSQEGSGSGPGPQSPSMIISPLYPQLSTLEVAKNTLKSLPSHLHLITSLSCLVISHNPDIDTLPLELSNLEHLWNLEYEGCPLTNPPAEDLDKFRLAADKLLYMRSLLHDAKPNESMKLMLVGLQKMGKTTLLNRLREITEAPCSSSTFSERVTGKGGSGRRNKGGPLSTVGVDLGIWKYRKDLEPEYLKSRKKGEKKLRSVTFYTWDFGGQEEYYATHQCFMSSRSLYLVVWNTTEGEAGVMALGLWLHNIQARAPGSPVVIVGTHCDRMRGDNKKAVLNHLIYEKYLVGRGPQQVQEMGLPKILDVLYVGCPPSGKAEGVVDLRMALYDIAFSLSLPRSGHGAARRTKLLEQPIPASFLKLEERVRELAVECRGDEKPPVLRESLFREYTKDIIANPRELNQAVTFLHENGIMLHYATPALSQLYFVDPQWLCDMLAHVVTVPEVNRFIQRHDGPEAGILRTSVLAHVFKGKLFPQQHRKEYVELLGKFEVALILDRNRLLVPSMLSPSPHYTVHTFRNLFPRPSLRQILARSPETPRLFGHKAMQAFTMLSPDSTASSEMCADSGTDLEHPSQLSVASHVSEELCRTGLILRRFYFMTYVPSGFWPRLISRFLTSSRFCVIVLRSLGFHEDQIKEVSSQLISGQMNNAISIEWSYWQTGIELWYKGLSLIRVAEILPNGSFQNCDPSPSIFEQSRTSPVEPAFDADDLSFELNGNWMPVDMTPNRGVEILVPDTVCPDVLQQEYASQTTATSDDPESNSPTVQVPQFESSWMSAEMLSLAVDCVDTLLEDWYPGLGARDGNKTVESIPYVNRVIPCPFCVSGATPLISEEKFQLFQSENGTATPEEEQSIISSNGPRSGANVLRPSSLKPPQNPIYRARANDVFPRASSPIVERRAKRSLFPQNGKAAGSVVFTKGEGKTSPTVKLKRSPETYRQRSLSEKSPNRVVMEGKPEIVRQRSLADLHRLKRTLSAEEDPSYPLALPLPPDNSSPEMGLTQATKFGFMIESLILATRKSEPLICPAHPEFPLPIRDLAPDVVFADLPTHFLLDPQCVDKGVYVDHGTFGDIYHGSVYPTPSATDDEGREVGIKIDRLDSKKYTPETATKAYIEVRAEVSILQSLCHPHIIEFIGVLLSPLCFILEWAPGGSLSSVFQKYRKMDARIGPLTLQHTASQVASGLSYLHEHNIVYYDLKSPNILVFQFPTPQESLQATQHLAPTGEGIGGGGEGVEGRVYVKIADLGISRRLTPGGVMGFKGSPGFMAPEILKYVGTEACTEKVDIFSFGMFLYELIGLFFPFEKQNLMGSQIEKLIVEGERPPLQNRELNNPILYLDTMRWCWQQDFRLRPSSQQLVDVLSNDSLARLVDAISLHSPAEVSCACVCTLPIEILSPPMMSMGGAEETLTSTLSSTPHPHVARGDLQEDLWLCLHCPEEGGRKSSQVCVINFRGKVSFSTESFPVCNACITSICGVNDTMWLGTEEGQVFVYDAITRHLLLDRHLAILPDQGISHIAHLQALRQVLVTRKDGCILLFDEGILEHKLPDDSRYDNHLTGTQLPVRSVFKTPEKLPVLCVHVVGTPGEDRRVVWCGTKYEMLLVYDVYTSRIEYCRKLYCRSRYDTSEENRITSVVAVDAGEKGYVWALSQPGNMLYCWERAREVLLRRVECSQFTHNLPVTKLCAMGNQLQLALSTGVILILNTEDSQVTSTIRLHGHVKSIHSLLPLGGRTLPKQWLPSIIGRSNVIDYYRSLLSEEDIHDITATMFGRQSQLLVSIGLGFYGLAGRLVEPLMTPKDQEENFILLWAI